MAAGAVGFEDAVRLVSERGEAMQQAADENPGVMLALSGVDDERARIACRRADGDVGWPTPTPPTNASSPGGRPSGYRAVDVAAELGAIRVIELRWGAPFTPH